MARDSAHSSILFSLFAVISVVLIIIPGSVKHEIASHIGPVFFFPASRAVALVDNVSSVLLDNRILRSRLADQSVDRAKLFELETQNRRLRKMIGLKEALPYDMIPGLVIMRPGYFGSEYLVIDVGEDAGLVRGQGVLSIDGLVGTVVEVEPHQALIRTLLSTDARVSVLITRTGAGGILTSEATGWFAINDIPIEVSVEVGDTVVTSGLGGVFPSGIPVGSITGIGVDERLLVHRLRVSPTVRFSRVREVFVISKSMPGLQGILNPEEGNH